MPWFVKTGLLSPLVVLPLVLSACKPTKGTANPEDYFPLIQVAFGVGETAAMIGRNEAITAKSFEGCVVAATLTSAFDSANGVLSGRLGNQVVIPAVDIDVSECLALRVSDTGENASVPTLAHTKVAGYTVAPEEETPETGTTEPAEEQPVVDTPVVEAPVVEAPVVEAATLSTGETEVAALVDVVAGITVAAVLHYATRLKTADCKKGTAALGAINYVNGMIKPISDEIANPDGKVSVPSVTIDLSECNVG